MTMTFVNPDHLKVYFDDVLAIDPPSCEGPYPPDDQDTLIFGRKYINLDTTSSTKLQLDEFAFWNRVLSSAEIATL